MITKFKLDDTLSPEIVVKKSFLTGRFNVFVNNKKIYKLKEPGKPYPIELNDGTIKKIIIKNKGFDIIPKVIVDGQEIQIADELKWYEYLICAIPLLLMFPGGALGGLFGGLGFYLNLIMIRSREKTSEKIGAIIFFSLISIVLYFLAAFLFLSIIS